MVARVHPGLLYLAISLSSTKLFVAIYRVIPAGNPTSRAHARVPEARLTSALARSILRSAPNAPAGSQTRGTSMGGLYVAATLQVPLSKAGRRPRRIRRSSIVNMTCKPEKT